MAGRAAHGARGGAGIVTLFNAADPKLLEVFARYALAPELRERG